MKHFIFYENFLFQGEKLQIEAQRKGKKRKETYFKHIHIGVDTASAGVNFTPVSTLPLKHTDVFEAQLPLMFSFSAVISRLLNNSQEKHHTGQTHSL